MLWGFVLVVVSFLTETLISQLLASAIDEGAVRIVTDYSPSVVALATARSELHRLQDLASNYVEGGGQGADRQPLTSAQAALDQAVGDYQRLPFGPGERQLWERVASDIGVVRRTIDRTIAAVERRDMAGARALVTRDLTVAVDRTSADFLADIELNADFANDDARLIARHRRRSRQAAIVLSLVSVAFTALVARLVYRLLAQHDALQREHAALLQETNAELEMFATRLSHDILSPLASTQLALDSALATESSPTKRRVLERGAGALKRVIRIVRALFEFARAGARPGPSESGDVEAVVTGVLDEYRPLATETGTSLEASLQARGSVACNEGLLTAAVSNLVRNALTHINGASEKRVDIVAADRGDRIRIEVRDTGPGLSPGTEAKVFEPFVRGAEATQPGLGLGLATVKRIVETHGGAVGVESKIGRGCRFWMDLPKRAA
jgi:signal transduction histidine kinase